MHPDGDGAADVRPLAYRLLTLRQEACDAHQWAGVTALAGTSVAAALAVFGLPPVDLHGPFHYAGLMDPLCGMTRAGRLLFLGRLGDTVRYNPGAPVLAAGALAALGRELWGRATGRWLNVRVIRRRPVIVAVVPAVCLWEANQQAQLSRLATGSLPTVLAMPPAAAGALAGVIAAGVAALLGRRRANSQPG